MATKQNERRYTIKARFEGYITDHNGNRYNCEYLEFTLSHDKGEYILSCTPIKRVERNEGYNLVYHDLYSGGRALVREGRFSKGTFSALIESITDPKTLQMYARAILAHSRWHKDFEVAITSIF